MKLIILSLVVVGFCLASCVKQDAQVQVVLQKIAIHPDTLTMTIGDTEKLTPVFTPATFSSIAVEWKSTDESVATFSAGGYLSAKKSGKIWVTVKDKNSATMGKAYVIVP